ncbi:aminoglycoside phosphotransferase family protein [Paractinoplanes ovalisporus]|nr:aminoglycoside phosphotransferase family protein [Actinoplanes ovalisporus]
MRERPEGLIDDDLRRGLAAGWGVHGKLTYLPVGAGGYHWAVGGRWFVTVDTRGDAAGLERALSTATALRLPFVIAPVPAEDGTTVRALSPRHLLSVYPMVEGVAGDFGPHPPEQRDRVLDLLIALHRATPAVASTAPRTALRLPGRAGLEEALNGLARPWTSGPYGEAAHRVLAEHAERVRGWLAEFDDLARAARDPAGWVVTHGEPHPGNFLRTAEGLRLIDWDTVLLAPAERDLWMLTGAMFGSGPGDDAELLGRYERETGRRVSPELIGFYRLWWMLADIAIYADELRRPHTANEDRAASLTYLAGYF